MAAIERDGSMTARTSEATARVATAAASLGLEVEIVRHGRSTRTAEEAAAACGCAVGQIIKSLIFKGRESGRPYLLLVSGANRVDEAAVAARLGEAIERPDAAFVRATTGFAIGGVPPFGHATPMLTRIDRDLMSYDVVWAAAGTPDSVMALAPRTLASAVGAEAIDVTAG
jgi:prolyl-tRNA editing enzyme YbaK/EbsC (Cys-tRNA(Pro) deacylase)